METGWAEGSALFFPQGGPLALGTVGPGCCHLLLKHPGKDRGVPGDVCLATLPGVGQHISFHHSSCLSTFLDQLAKEEGGVGEQQ